MLIEVHMLKNFAPTNLNRDESGAPKSCMFGGVKRGRISSQCLKHSWRSSAYFQEEIGKDAISIRTRKLPDIVAEKLSEANIPEDVMGIVKSQLSGIGTKDGAPNKKENKTNKKENKTNEKENKTAQIIMYSSSDIDAIVDYVKSTVEGKNANEVEKLFTKASIQAALKKNTKRSVSLDMALFGRMVTSDAFANVEASMQVAHAISTNKIMMESDFFNAVDDFIDGNEETESAILDDIDYNSSCYYLYASIDTDKLLSNMCIDMDDSAYISTIIPRIVETIAFTNPTGKQNSFAGHSLPSAVLVEVKDKKVPVSYANAFEIPARANINGGIVDNSIQKLAHECEKINAAYGIPTAKRLWFSMNESIQIHTADTKNCKSFIELVENIL